jgi:hypothetical protein
VAMRNRRLRSEFYRPVSLLLVVAASYRFPLTIFGIELLSWLLCQS